jgi:hypothetical protein
MEECRNHKYTHMLFVDSDIEFSFETIMKLVAADKDIVAAPYPLKALDWDKIAKYELKLEILKMVRLCLNMVLLGLLN